MLQSLPMQLSKVASLLVNYLCVTLFFFVHSVCGSVEEFSVCLSVVCLSVCLSPRLNVCVGFSGPLSQSAPVLLSLFTLYKTSDIFSRGSEWGELISENHLKF